LDVLQIVEAIVLGIVLGITEFLPVSSLGHSLALASLFNFPPTKEARDTFAIFIQLGAVLAVLVFYSRDLWRQTRELPANPKTRRLWLNVLIAFVPIGILGFVFNSAIKKYLFSPLIVAVALVLGGIVLLLVGRRTDRSSVHTPDDISVRQALTIGLYQIAALIPGVSRSGATIIGGLMSGLDQTVATSFTFLLFIPTLGSAALYSLYTAFRDKTVDPALIPYFLLAAAVGFIASLISMRWLLRYVSTHDFRPFGVYRIVVGVILIGLFIAGRLQ
jgi:undecaprenyl-diphosphatase